MAKIVFVDSITKAGLTTEQIHQMHEKFPGTGFIFIAQSTKDGIAKSYGRFNQGGEMRVF